MQESYYYYWQDSSIVEQIWYFNFITEMDLIFCHNDVDLKYYNGHPVIKKIKRISKPGIRVYSKITDLPKPYGGLGISILSTPKGVMTDQNARKHNVGGEILCEVF